MIVIESSNKYLSYKYTIETPKCLGVQASYLFDFVHLRYMVTTHSTIVDLLMLLFQNEYAITDLLKNNREIFKINSEIIQTISELILGHRFVFPNRCL